MTVSIPFAPGEMMEFLDILLWISLVILVVGVLLPKKHGFKVAAFGWVVFGLRWLLALPGFFFVEHNIMYTVACILALPVTLYVALLMIRDQRESLMAVTKAAAIGSVVYFPFAGIPALGDWIMGVTAGLAVAIVNALGYPAMLIGLNVITLNGQGFEIILACTALQGMALFVGVIGCVKAPMDRLAKAFLVSVPVIYVLNLVRIAFVVIAGGSMWFQSFPDIMGLGAEENSSFWVHNVFAEAGSLIALVVISYVVITILPETLVYLRDLFGLVTPKNILNNIRGERAIEATPIRRKV